ncbi:MAG: hypothetical protein ACPK85_04420 [Methanosarcina sp.]
MTKTDIIKSGEALTQAKSLKGGLIMNFILARGRFRKIWDFHAQLPTRDPVVPP